MQIPKTKESDKQTKYRNFRSPGIASLRGPETCPVLLTDSPLCAAGKFPLIAYRNPAIRLFSVPFLFRFLLRFRFCPLCLHRFLRFVMRSGRCWLFRLCRSLRRLRFLRRCRSLRWRRCLRFGGLCRQLRFSRSFRFVQCFSAVCHLDFYKASIYWHCKFDGISDLIPIRRRYFRQDIRLSCCQRSIHKMFFLISRNR